MHRGGPQRTGERERVSELRGRARPSGRKRERAARNTGRSEQHSLQQSGKGYAISSEHPLFLVNTRQEVQKWAVRRKKRCDTAASSFIPGPLEEE